LLQRSAAEIAELGDWQGFVFMFGCLFWEASRDVRGKVALLKYNWIEKTITATAITVGYFSGDIPQRLVDR